jgi:C-terminal processing protease CtpA/Prc
MVLSDKASATVEPAAPIYGEILENHVGYLRPGAMNSANLQTMDKKLIEFASKKVDGLIIDLRASAATDFATAADFAKRFCAKGKTLFTLRKAGKEEKAFVSDRDPTFQGMMLILIDGDTASGAEAMASAVRALNKALTIGQPTAGSAVEYADLPLPSGKILRVAVAEAAGPDGASLYPQGVKPDLPVEMSLVEKRQIFLMSIDRGMGPFVYETERPHFNEAALMAGTNPELESVEQRRGRGRDSLPRDAVVQRALDLITSLEVLQKR